MSRPFTLISAMVFFVVAVAHLIRIVLRFQLVIGSHHIPLWLSYFGVLIPAFLGISLLRERKGG